MRARALALLVLATALTGCVSGLIYTHVTVPLDVNLDRTPVHDDYAREESWNTIQYYARIDWGSDGIGETAKEHGFTRVDYADLETLSVLGIWTQRWARVYGERKAP
jgi:hypothetical protein